MNERLTDAEFQVLRDWNWCNLPSPRLETFVPKIVHEIDCLRFDLERLRVEHAALRDAQQAPQEARQDSQEPQVRIIPVGSKVRVGDVPGTVTGVMLRLTIHSPHYEVEWWDGRDCKSGDFFDFQITPSEERRATIGFTTPRETT